MTKPEFLRRISLKNVTGQPMEAGFTLVELLVSLSLVGLASTLLLYGLQSSGLIIRQQRAGNATIDEIAAAQRLLRSSIESLRPIPRVDSAGSILDIRGTEGFFTYIAPPHDRAGPDALQRFRLTRNADGSVVLYHASTLTAGIDRSGASLTGWTPQTLLRGVRNLTMSYLGSSTNPSDRRWVNRWWDHSNVPALVRIRVEFAAGDKRVWPDLIIRPRAAIDVACRIDPLTGNCRKQT